MLMWMKTKTKSYLRYIQYKTTVKQQTFFHSDKFYTYKNC
jgi:hypothetical protein